MYIICYKSPGPLVVKVFIHSSILDVKIHVFRVDLHDQGVL